MIVPILPFMYYTRSAIIIVSFTETIINICLAVHQNCSIHVIFQILHRLRTHPDIRSLLILNRNWILSFSVVHSYKNFNNIFLNASIFVRRTIRTTGNVSDPEFQVPYLNDRLT